MDTFYLILVIFLFILAIFDLVVGVSNDAVNFLNGAIGSKAASFRFIMIVAAAGILTGAAFSNGMMDIARHGIYQPQNFSLQEIMWILLAVMLTDVVLLDVFNSLGMPTSTTVSMVFELLGGTFALAIMKVSASDGAYDFGDLLNSGKALTVILAIFLSVGVAFFFGTIVQYIARLIFTFNYKKKMKYSIALFGGFAITAIIYFILIKGLKDATFMRSDTLEWVSMHTGKLAVGCLVIFTILMQVLHWLKVNVLKVVVLFGTFALALAFAGNDLVNFIGVPLAGFSSYTDYIANGNGVPVNEFMMDSLLGSAKTPWYFLIGSGIVMVIALFTSRKAQNVVKTSVDLSRQDEGEENFGTSQVARVLVRTSCSINNSVSAMIPQRARQWIDTRFNQNEAILADGAAFDLVRASVNLVLGGLLIALGTSMKLPLSTTYVAFMVAMGSSLSDRAWGRESAVYRITGVLSVIGGWFITAGAAFVICFIVVLIIHFGGIPAVVVLVALAIYALIRSQLTFKKKMDKNKPDVTAQKMLDTQDQNEVLNLLRQQTRKDLNQILEFASETFNNIVTAFLSENLRILRKEKNTIETEKKTIRQVKSVGTLGISQLDYNVALEKGLFYYQGNDFASEIVYSVGRICEPCLEHIDNNFNPLQDVQKEEFQCITTDIICFLNDCRQIIETNNYNICSNQITTAQSLNERLALLRKGEIKRIQGQSGSTKVSIVYLGMIQEAQNIVTYTSNLLKVSRKFQQD